MFSSKGGGNQIIKGQKYNVQNIKYINDVVENFIN